MRRKQAPEGGRVSIFAPIRFAPVLLAGCVGYLLGSAHIEAFRAADLSAAQSVALRFPQDLKQDWRDASRVTTTAMRTAAIKLQPSTLATDASVANLPAAQGSTTTAEAHDALLDPAPMAPRAGESTATLQVASAEDDATYAATAPSAGARASAQLPAPKSAQDSAASAQPAPAPKITNVAPHRPVSERPGYVLNDAQIASIRERLHLTPEQEEMWPAVEAALRNIAYSHAQQARSRGAASGTQAAAIDPNAVQGLKSAAVPLIMSFNSEQKEEVRNLVHVMGLDQLASQF